MRYTLSGYLKLLGKYIISFNDIKDIFVSLFYVKFLLLYMVIKRNIEKKKG